MNRASKVLLVLLIISVVLNIFLLTFMLRLRKLARQENQASQIIKKDIDSIRKSLTKETLEITKDSDSFRIDTLEYNQVDEKPTLISTPKVPYPRIPEGTGSPKIVVKVLIDTNGTVIDAKLMLSHGDQLLEEVALTAAKQAKFIPAIHNGKPVRVWITFPIEFTLE